MLHLCYFNETTLKTHPRIDLAVSDFTSGGSYLQTCQSVASLIVCFIPSALCPFKCFFSLCIDNLIFKSTLENSANSEEQICRFCFVWFSKPKKLGKASVNELTCFLLFVTVCSALVGLWFNERSTGCYFYTDSSWFVVYLLIAYTTETSVSIVDNTVINSSGLFVIFEKELTLYCLFSIMNSRKEDRTEHHCVCSDLDSLWGICPVTQTADSAVWVCLWRLRITAASSHQMLPSTRQHAYLSRQFFNLFLLMPKAQGGYWPKKTKDLEDSALPTEIEDNGLTVGERHRAQSEP